MDDIVVKLESAEQSTLVNGSKQNNVHVVPRVQSDDTFPLLTRADLLELDSKEPVWRRIRFILFGLFWILWIGLLLAAVLIIVFSAKCPVRPKLAFWQESVGYRVNPFAFSDSSGNGVGDLKGLSHKLDYIKNTVGVGYIILDNILDGYYKLGFVEDYFTIDKELGTLADFKWLLRTCHKIGLQLVVGLDINIVSYMNNVAKNETMLTRFSPGMISRSGVIASYKINGVDYYSVFGEKSVALNLESPDVMEFVENVIKYWCDMGVDGILLDNAAFYVVDDTRNSAKLVDDPSPWYSEYRASQIFTSPSVAVVQKIRKFIDGISTRTGQSKVLIVDPGDTGYGLQLMEDVALKYLGSPESPGAHLIISHEFKKNRGWKVNPIHVEMKISSISSYNISAGKQKASVALTTATNNYPRRADLSSLVSSLLLPGCPILFFGSELGIELKGNVFPTTMYPHGAAVTPVLPREDDVRICRLPMPWDDYGVEFSSKFQNSSDFNQYLKNFDIQETVRSATAIGRGDSVFSLVQRLIQMRKQPSLQWGDLKIVDSVGAGFQVFLREAIGFPTFIIILHNGPAIPRKTFDFSSVCANVKPQLIYPKNGNLELGKVVPSRSIYITANKMELVYVFECA